MEICEICGNESEVELVEHDLHGPICEECQDNLWEEDKNG